MRRWAVVLGILFAAVCIGAGCQRPPKPLVFATFTKALGNLPFHVAKEQGWFKASPELSGFEISFSEFGDRPSIVQAFEGNSLHVLFSAEIPAILNRAQGVDVRIAAVSASAVQEVLIQKSSTALKVSDLAGRSVGVQQGTSSHYGLFKILSSHGLTQRNVDLRFMQAAEGRTAFEGGSIEAWAVWAPWVEQQQGPGRGRVLNDGGAEIVSVMSVSNSIVTDQPRAVQSIVDTIQRAKSWIVANPDQAMNIAVRELGLDADVVALAFPKFSWNRPLTDAVVLDFQEKSNFLTREGMTRDKRLVDVNKELVLSRYVTK